MTSHWPLSVLSALSSILGMILPMALVRLLSPDQVGQFRVFFLYLLLAPAVTFTSGMITGVYYWSGRQDQGARSLQNAWSLVLLASGVLALVALPMHGWVAHLLSWDPASTIAFILLIPVLLVSMFLEQILIANGRIWGGAVYFTGFEILRTAGVILAAKLSHDLPTLFWTYTAIFAVKSITGFVIARQQGLLSLRLDLSRVRSVLDYSLPVSLSSAFGLLSHTSDRFILAGSISAAQFALYSIGCLSIPPLDTLEQSVNKVLIPKLASALECHNRPEATSLYLEAQRQLLWLMIPASAGLFVFAHPIIVLLFTEKYAAATDYLRWYSLNYILLAIPFNILPRATGSSRWIFTTCVKFSVLAILLGLLMTRTLGAFGALGSVLLTQASLRIYGARWIRQQLQWRWIDIFPWRSGLLYAAIALVLAAASLSVRALFANELLWFALSAPSFAGIYLGLAALAPARARRPALASQYGRAEVACGLLRRARLR